MTLSFVTTFISFSLHNVLYSSFPRGKPNIDIPREFLDVEQPNIEQLAPGITRDEKENNFSREFEAPFHDLFTF